MEHNTEQSLRWLPELTELVQAHLKRWEQSQDSRLPDLEQELVNVDERIRGYSQSLANPDLAAILRRTVEMDYATALERKGEIEAAILERGARHHHISDLVDSKQVLERLERLSEVLASNNPTLGNLELSLHIDRIACFPDGRVVLRTCMLGALHEAVDLFVDDILAQNAATQPSVGGRDVAKPRRRGRRRYYDHQDGGDVPREVADFAADPSRFAGLSDEFFWIDEFQVPEKTCWSEEHAREVWDYWKAEKGRSQAAVSRHFGRSIPTIRRALRLAKEQMTHIPDASSPSS